MSAIANIVAETYFDGLTISDYVSGMSKNRELFEENYRNFTLDPVQIQCLHEIEGPVRVLALVEDWCGDVMRYLPAMARIAQAAGWDLRMFYRDHNPHLADAWLKEGLHRSIPVFVFFDEGWNELSHFIEKPPEVYAAEAEARARFAEQHPELPDAGLPTAQMSQATLDVYTPYIRALRVEHNLDWERLFARHIMRALGSAAICA
jgi:hypothetical protein